MTWHNSDAEGFSEYGPQTYVMLLNPQCDWEFRDQFDFYMRHNDSQYEQYLKDNNYQVICLGGVSNLDDVQSHIVPTLRHSLSNVTFIFVYPDSMLEQYNDYVEGKYGHQYRYLALGNTDLQEGIAYSSEVPAHVKHEMAHLATCGTWHDEQGKDIGRMVRHADADLLPWCFD
jgi:hypothetical protein